MDICCLAILGPILLNKLWYCLRKDIFLLTCNDPILGNHEDRSIQKCFTFYKECLTKFGSELGQQVKHLCFVQ